MCILIQGHVGVSIQYTFVAGPDGNAQLPAAAFLDG
jgi:hypothetical protein